MKKYSWDFDEYSERWSNDDYDTIEECIQAAKKDCDNKTNTVFIGENLKYIPYVDADSILEGLQEQASEFAGSAGDDWDPCDYKKQNEIDELSEKLSEATIEWMRKYGYSPEFYQVDNIKEYLLN